MTALPVLRRRDALGRCLSGLALALALLLAGGGGRANAASAPPPAPVATASAAPGYELHGFRWNRTIVPVYYNWEGGTCIFSGNDFSGPPTAIAPQVLMENLQASINEINAHLRGGLTLELVGLATHAELCGTTSTRPIVVGFGAIGSTGRALSLGTGTADGPRTYTAARVFVINSNNFTCPSAPIYRDLQHTMTHELLHAIGIGHSQVPSSIMTPSFTACRTPYTLQPDDIAGINALYPPTLPPPGTSAPAGVTSSSAFATAVVFAPSGQALAVFSGGTLDQLEAGARAIGAGGVWMQDAGGTFRLLVVSGPGFLREQFRTAFPAGLPANVAVTLVR